MAKDTPFNDDMMTLIMGIEPDEPGQHGRTLAPMPDKDAIGLITEIKDMCEEFLMHVGKGDESEDDTEDMETSEEEE